MQKSTKNLLGLSGLALVGAMTVAALAIPVPDANATGGASVGGEVQIQVKVYSGDPESIINAPDDGSVTTNSVVNVEHTYGDADSVDYTVKWGDGTVGDDTSVSGTTQLDTFIPSYAPSAGDNNFPLNLLAYGGYGKYVLTSTVNSNGQKVSDSTSFRYAPVSVTYIGTDENGDPIFEILYNAETTKVDFDLLDSNGKTVLDNVISLPIENPGTEGKLTVTVPASNYGLESGNYSASATAYGPIANAEVDDDSVVVIYNVVNTTFRINVDYATFATGGTVYVDGNYVDPSDYDAATGSTLITLHDDYIQTLSLGTHTMTVTFSSGASASTTFTLVGSDSGVAVASGATITADYTYDDNTREIYFHVIDKNGNLIAVPSSRTVVSNQGVAGSGTVTLDLSDFDLTGYDFSEIRVVALAYPIIGSTKNIGVLDSDTGPVQLNIKYTKPDSPDVPDTGIFGGVINLAKADYVITGIIGFSIVTVFALVFLRKHDHHSSRRRR